MAEQPTLLHTACIRLPGMRRPLQGATYSFPSQRSLLAAVGRRPLIAWPLCPAGSAREKAGWAAGRPRPVRVPGAPGPPHCRPRTPRDGGGFDRLEQFLLRGAVVDGAAHVGGHAILQATRRQDPQHNQFLHFDQQRAVLAHTEASDFTTGGGVGRIKPGGPVHVTVAIRIVHILRLLRGLRRHASS